MDNDPYVSNNPYSGTVNFMSIKKVFRFPFHPFLFGIFPAVSFLANNIEEVLPGAAFRIFLIVLAGVLLLFILLSILQRDWHKSAFLVTIFLILFFSYGHLYNSLKQTSLFGIAIGRHRYLSFINLLILMLGWRWVIKHQRTAAHTISLNILGTVLLLLPLLQIAWYQIRFRSTIAPLKDSDTQLSAIDPNSNTPDIYYIILDAYTRDDTMRSFYEFDNTPFLETLEDRGFYVARCSQSNYAKTNLSLASTLNLNYVQDIYDQKQTSGLAKLVQNSLVRKKLEKLGYSVVAFETTYIPTRWEDATIYYSFEEAYYDQPKLFKGFSEFEAMFTRTTGALILLDVDTILKARLQMLTDEGPKRERYDRILYNLDLLIDVPSIPGPKFVYAHINAPHEPYIVDKNGGFLADQEEYIPGYRDQVMYINNRILPIIDNILSKSEQPPIIILQGDHGGGETWGDFRRMHILNAYYLPEGGAPRLYPTITPVNTFRIIFDFYFGSNYGLLPDISYYSHWRDNFNFTIAPNTRVDCEYPK